MRHRVAKKKLNRDTDHRTSLIRNLSTSLILNGSIKTTLAKAKYVQPYIEKLISKAKRGNTFANINLVNSKLRSKQALRVLFDDLAKRFDKRNGGYTKITKLGFRDGDRAPMAKIEFVSSGSTDKTDKKSLEAKKKTKAVKTTKSAKKETSKTQTKVTEDVNE